METDEQHDEETTGEKPAAPSSIAPVAAAAPVGESHEPTCESCDEPSVKGDQPVTSTKPFKRGFCSTHSKDSPKRTIEFWAKAKGMTPRILEQGAVRQTGALHNAKQNPKHADFHRARAFSGWPMGHEITEAAFDEAVKESATPSFR